MIDYLGESLVSQGIIEQERADICGFEILEKIFETEPDSEVRRKTDRENLLNWVRKGSVPDKNWKEFVMGKRKVLSDDNFLNIAQRVIQLDPDEIEGKKSVDENKTEIVDEKILEARKAEKAEALLDNYNYELIYNDYQLKMDLTQKLENYIGYRGINPSASILSKIIFCIIHGLYGRAKKSVPYGIQTSFYLERKIDAKIEDDWNFVWVRGDAYSGKTRWLLKYAEKSDKEAVYIKNPMSYQEIIEKITIEEDNVLDESTRKILGCHFRRSIEGKVERIQHLVKDFVLIIDGDSLKKTDQRKLFELSKSDRVQVFIETRLDVNDNDPKQPIVSIPAFTERETINLFYLVSGKYVDIEKLDKDDELSAILPTLCKQVFNNPGLIILLAENYWSRIKKDNTESGKRNALKFLEDIINFQPIGTKDEIDWGEKCSSSIHYSNGKQSQNKLDGHIRHLFSSCVPEMDKDVFYVISLLDGIKLEVRHLKNWFGISEATIHKLEVEGWCNIDQSSLVVGIPQLIVHALKVDVHKNINTSRNFLRYIKNISATLNRMEVEPADVEIMQQVILQLHNILVNQLKIAETKVKKEWFEFHFTCVRYFLYYGNALKADQLKNMSNIKAVEGYEDVKIYEDMLETIRDYIGKNEIESMEEDICNILRSGKVFISNMATKAFLDMIFLYSERVLIQWVSFMQNMDDEKYAIVYTKTEGLKYIYSIIVEKVGRNEKIIKLVHLYSKAFGTLTNYPQWPVYTIIECEESWSSLEQQYDCLSNRICDIERKIYFQSIFLLICNAFYFHMVIERNQLESCNEIEKCDTEMIELNKSIGDTKLKIQEIAEQLVVLKGRIHELPCNCAGICLLACGMAGCILQDKSLMQVNDYDFKHMDLYDQQEQEKLKQIIFEYRRWGEKEKV